MLGNSEWQAILQNISDKKFRNCRFPKTDEIGIEGNQDHVTITIKSKGLYGNMQSDAAAFEAWSLVLLCHCGVETVAIHFEGEVEQPESEQMPHFERLLYRLARFAELFPQRIQIEKSVKERARSLRSEVRLVLNEPGNKRGSIETELQARFEAIISKTEGHSERDLEMALEVSDAFRKELDLDKVVRQWPVGLFEERIAAGPHRIFSGGKSAIDLIGIRQNRLVLVELKKNGNNKVGGLSELFFYSSMMRDAIRGTFKFDGQPLTGNSAITAGNILGCSRIHAILLAPTIHPMLLDPKIMAELNLSAQSRWPDLPVQFGVLRVAAMPTKPGEDFIFSQTSTAPLQNG